MQSKIKKIIKIFGLSVVIGLIGFFLHGFVVVYIVSKTITFQNDKKLIDKYSYIFNKDYVNDIKLESSNSSKITGYLYFYTYKSEIICLMELNRFNNIDINNIEIKSYYLKKEKSTYPNIKITGTSHLEPRLIVVLYPSFKKASKINIYMENIVEMNKREEFLYLKFKGIFFEISSTDEYSELSSLLIDPVEPVMDLMILKKGEKILFITKYKGKDGEKNISNQRDVSLLDLINVGN